jgi:hypothetical protein
MALNDNIFTCLESGTQKAENYLNNILWYLLRRSDFFTKSILNKVFNNHIPEILQNHYSVQLQCVRGGDIYDIAFIDRESRVSLVFELKITSGEFNEQLMQYHSNPNTKVVLISPDISKEYNFITDDISAISWGDIYEMSMNSSSCESNPVLSYLLKEFCEFMQSHGLTKNAYVSLPSNDIELLKRICEEAKSKRSDVKGVYKAGGSHRGFNIYLDKDWGISLAYSTGAVTEDCYGLVVFLWAIQPYDHNFCRGLNEYKITRELLSSGGFTYGEDSYEPYWVKKINIDYKNISTSKAIKQLNHELSRTKEFLETNKGKIELFVKRVR